MLDGKSFFLTVICNLLKYLLYFVIATTNKFATPSFQLLFCHLDFATMEVFLFCAFLISFAFTYLYCKEHSIFVLKHSTL